MRAVQGNISFVKVLPDGRVDCDDLRRHVMAVPETERDKFDIDHGRQ